MFWKDCLLGKIHFSTERFSFQSLFWNDACLATSIFLTRHFWLIRAKENLRYTPTRISSQKVLSQFNICIENTHPGLFLPLSCRWNYQSSVQVERETNKEPTNKQRTNKEQRRKHLKNRFLISLAVSSGSRDGPSLPKVPLLWPLPHRLHWTQVNCFLFNCSSQFLVWQKMTKKLQATELVFVNTFCMLLSICR